MFGWLSNFRWIGREAAGWFRIMEDSLDSLVGQLAIADEDTLEVVLPSEVGENRPSRFYLVGELLTQKPYRRDSLVNLFRSLWIPAKDRAMKSLLQASYLDNSERILFSFEREMDRQWVLGGAPWEFDKCLFVIAPTNGMENPRQVPLSFSPFWIRIRDLPPMVLEEDKIGATGKCIGQALGRFLKLGKGKGNDSHGSFLRIRVDIDVEAPLRKKISFRSFGEANGCQCEVEYERLPFFCLYCGLLSHIGSRCPRFSAGEITEPRFPIHLNAERKARLLQWKKDEKLKQMFAHPPANSRFGVRRQDRSGWRMTAPDLPTVGFRRPRGELEGNYESVAPEGHGQDDMEVETDHLSRTIPGEPPGKKSRYDTGKQTGKLPKAVAGDEGKDSNRKGDSSLETPDFQDGVIESIIKSDIRDVQTLNPDTDFERRVDESYPETQNIQHLEKARDLMKIDDANPKLFPGRERKEVNEEVGNIGLMDNLRAGPGKWNATISNPDPKMTQGLNRILEGNGATQGFEAQQKNNGDDRLSVMGPVSTHHAQ